MKRTVIISLSALCLSLLLFPSVQGKVTLYHHTQRALYTANPPGAKTGAPGEGSCTSCHGGTAQSGSGVVSIDFSGSGGEYMVGNSYTITISIASGTKNGFEMTILDGNNTKAGTFTSGTNYSLTTTSGRQYARQNAASGIVSWTVNWTAPDTDLGDLTLYYSFNKSNANGSASGDIIYLGQFNITSAAFNTVTEYERTDKNIRMYYAPETGLSVDYDLEEASLTCLLVQDLSGRVVYRGDSEFRTTGTYHEQLQVEEQVVPGLYIVSLFVDNNAYNRKVFIGTSN